MISKKVVTFLLIAALILSVTATYVTITKFDEAKITSSFNKGNIGVMIKPARNAEVGVLVSPVEEKEE